MNNRFSLHHPLENNGKPIIFCDPPLEGVENMARDNRIFSNSGHFIRIYSWIEPTLSLGYGQRKEKLPDFLPPELKVVHRLTGGRGVLHHQEITYAVAGPIDEEMATIGKTYMAIGKKLLDSLFALGIDANIQGRSRGDIRNSFSCFSAPSQYEIIRGSRKLVGSAQKRDQKRFLQHGSIILDIAPEYKHFFPGDCTSIRAELGKKVDFNHFYDILTEKFSSLWPSTIKKNWEDHF